MEKEELRRLWWSVWELDCFASGLSSRPFAFDPQDVMLPSADENWFSKTPIASTHLRGDFRTVWKCLQGSSNQDRRAWYLLCNHLCVTANKTRQQHGTSLEMKRDLEFASTCFALALPREFDLGSGLLYFDDNNFRKSSWIMLTILMLQR